MRSEQIPPGGSTLRNWGRSEMITTQFALRLLPQFRYITDDDDATLYIVSPQLGQIGDDNDAT